MNIYKKMCNFALPISALNKKVYDLFIPMLNEHPDYFVENAKISAIYGSPNCYWNGGRVLFQCIHIGKMHDFKLFLEKYNIPFRFTFSNNQLLECHLHDYYCNRLLEMYSNGKHEIILNSPLLENYIRNKYGNKFKYISSTTKVLTNPEEQKREIKKDYFLIVLDYRYNTDIPFLKSIEEKDKCEILINSVCDPDCTRREEHYKSLSIDQISNGYSKDRVYCKNESRNLQDCFNLETFIKAEQIDNYIDLGFSNFKIEGRNTSSTNLLETLLYYLVKDKYKDIIRKEIQKTL